ncbi:MAG TPA: AsmA family protein [Pseudoxanthomonas sp.]|nr:AsmA family protein [Pseudoxanthomonas sp.]
MAINPPDPLPFYRRKPSRPVLIGGGVLAVALLVLLLVFDWNWLKWPVQGLVKAQTGRDFVIEGDLDVDLGRITTVTAENLSFANAAWSRNPTMASAERAALQVELFPLLFRWQVRLPLVRLDKPDIRLETGPDGKGNWEFSKDEPNDEPLPLRRLWIEDGRMRYASAVDKTEVDVAIDSAMPNRDGAAPPIEIDGKGRWRGSDFKVSGRAESPLELAQTDAPYRIDLRASAGATEAKARGSLVNPFQLQQFDLQLGLSGQDMKDLYPLTGIATPPTPPYRFDGRLSRKGNTWRYRDFSGKAGDSDLRGTAEFRAGGEQPVLIANLVSRRLDLDDLGGFVGAPPQTGSGEVANARAKAQAAKLAAAAKVLPQTPYNLERLRAMDADVRLKATRIEAPGLPIDDMEAHLQLEGGLLRLAPLNFGVAGGDIRSTIRMDARRSTIRTRADVQARGLNLGSLFPDVKVARDAIGRVSGSMALTGTGNSIAAMLGSADGDITFGMGSGRISNLLMELAGLDIAEALKFLVIQDRTVPIRCAFGDFAVNEGVMDTRSLAFDSKDTIIIGKGQISLKDETLGLELRPRPKDRSIFALRSPLVVGGTFKDPTFRPDMKRLGARGALALALGSIAPPAALLATLELGPGEDSGCGGRYAK